MSVTIRIEDRIEDRELAIPRIIAGNISDAPLGPEPGPGMTLAWSGDDDTFPAREIARRIVKAVGLGLGLDRVHPDGTRETIASPEVVRAGRSAWLDHGHCFAAGDDGTYATALRSLVCAHGMWEAAVTGDSFARSVPMMHLTWDLEVALGLSRRDRTGYIRRSLAAFEIQRHINRRMRARATS